MKQMKCWTRVSLLFVLLLVWSIPPIAFAEQEPNRCSTVIFSKASDTNIEALMGGQKAYGSRHFDYEIDEQTARDLKVEAAEDLLTPYLHTDLGRRRWRYLLRHPLLDSEQIRARQTLVRYMADHRDKFQAIKKHLEQIHSNEDQFAEDFAKLNLDPDSLPVEVFWAAFTLVCYFTPTVAKFIGELSVGLQAMLLGQGYAAGAVNAVKRTRPKREVLEPYRLQMLTVRRALTTMAPIEHPAAQEISSALQSVRVADRPSILERLYTHLNAYLNRSDADLAKHMQPLGSRVDQSPQGLRTIYRRLLLLQTSWTVHLFGRDIPLTDISLKWDMFHISNFRLRGLREMIVEKKEEIAELLSAVADLEVYLAMADFYHDHRDRTTFLDILDAESPTRFEMSGAHHPLTARQQLDSSTANDVSFGDVSQGAHNSFVVVSGEPGEGSSHYQRMTGLNAVLAQIGMPIFAREGSLTPLVIMTSLDLQSNIAKGMSFSHYEARRWGQMENLAKEYPHTMVLLNDPFSGTGDVRSLALKVEIIREMVISPTIGMMSTHSRNLLAAIRDWDDVALKYAQNHQIRHFDPEADRAILDPEGTFRTLADQGVSPEFIDRVRRSHQELRRLLPKRMPTINELDFEAEQQIKGGNTQFIVPRR